jgi:O-antigen/teichoic acid export membrane protein
MIRKVAENTFFLSAAQITARFLGFLYFIFLARFLGVATFGIYNFTLAFIYNFIPVADFGIERLVLRDISREPGKISFYLARLLPLRLLLSLGAYLLVLILGLILGQSLRQIGYLAVFGLFIFPYSFTYLLSSFLNAQEKMKYMAAAVVGSQVLIFILGVIFVLFKLPLSVIFLAGFLGQLAVTLVFLLKARSWGLPLGWVVDKEFFKKALSSSWAFAFLLILAVFYLRISVILIGLLKGAYLTGLYSSAFKFIEAMILIPQSLALALFPLFSRLFLEDKVRLASIYKKGLGILFLFSLPFALALIFFAKWIIVLAYGQNYLPALISFKILGLSLILFFMNALPGNIILNSPRIKNFLPLAFLNFLIVLIFGLIFIPKYNIVGAAWVVVLGEAAGFIINNLFVYKTLKSSKNE